jgi:hypothetical protein
MEPSMHMPNSVHVTLTVKLKGGGEIPDIEGEAASLSYVAHAVEEMIDAHGVKDDQWSSLVVVVVAQS